MCSSDLFPSHDKDTDWVRDLISENSTPEYSSEEVKNLDEYVKNGGKFEDYYNRAQEGIDLDHIKIENEEDQRAVVREYLKKTGYTD